MKGGRRGWRGMELDRWREVWRGVEGGGGEEVGDKGTKRNEVERKEARGRRKGRETKREEKKRKTNVKTGE